MLKYQYTLRKDNNEIYKTIFENKEIEDYMRYIRGVYIHLAWIEQKNMQTEETIVYFVHQNNGYIYEYMTYAKYDRKGVRI